MANAYAKVAADRFLNWIKGTAYPATSATLYVALLITVPTKNDGTGLVECSDTGYARQPIASTAWSAISTNADNIHEQISNSNAITFGAAAVAYTVAGLALYDAVTAGNLLYYSPETAQSVSVGNQYQIAVGALIPQS